MTNPMGAQAVTIQLPQLVLVCQRRTNGNHSGNNRYNKPYEQKQKRSCLQGNTKGAPFVCTNASSRSKTHEMSKRQSSLRRIGGGVQMSDEKKQQVQASRNRKSAGWKNVYHRKFGQNFKLLVFGSCNNSR